jgi:hypothetical protein
MEINRQDAKNARKRQPWVARLVANSRGTLLGQFCFDDTHDGFTYDRCETLGRAHRYGPEGSGNELRGRRNLLGSDKVPGLRAPLMAQNTHALAIRANRG